MLLKAPKNEINEIGFQSRGRCIRIGKIESIRSEKECYIMREQ